MITRKAIFFSSSFANDNEVKNAKHGIGSQPRKCSWTIDKYYFSQMSNAGFESLAESIEACFERFGGRETKWKIGIFSEYFMIGRRWRRTGSNIITTPSRIITCFIGLEFFWAGHLELLRKKENRKEWPMLSNVPSVGTSPSSVGYTMLTIRGTTTKAASFFERTDF